MSPSTILERVLEFLDDWNLAEWMAENGEWDDDHIAEGVIDPDGYVGNDERERVCARVWEGWECREGWTAYRCGAALVLNWWRSPTTRLRRERDLWVTIDPKFFEADAEVVS